MAGFEFAEVADVKDDKFVNWKDLIGSVVAGLKRDSGPGTDNKGKHVVSTGVPWLIVVTDGADAKAGDIWLDQQFIFSPGKTLSRVPDGQPFIAKVVERPKSSGGTFAAVEFGGVTEEHRALARKAIEKAQLPLKAEPPREYPLEEPSAFDAAPDPGTGSSIADPWD